jgi:hypothetical protein
LALADGTFDAEDAQKFSVVVWPLREPVAEGILYELDTYELATPIEHEANVDITIRVSEKLQPTGYRWEAPTQTFTCVELKSANLGDFTTGYQQWHFKTLDQNVDCEEDVILTRTDGRGVDTVKVKVFRGHCPVVECKDTEIQNLDKKSCECQPLHETEGEIFDSRTVHDRQVRLDVNQKFTVREWAKTPTSEGFEWSTLNADDLDCVT